MKTKLLLLVFALLFAVSLQAQNTIDIVNPPASVEGNSEVQITFNYTLDIPAYAYIRFKNGSETANNLTEANVLLAAGSGSKTVNLPIPRSFNGELLPLGEGYSYQAQLFDHNNGWAGLDTKDYSGVSLTAAANFVALKTYPTTVNASSTVDITLDYATDKPNPTHVFVRLHNASGVELSSIGKSISASSGSVTLSLDIPDVPLGSNYEYRVLYFHPATTWNVAFATDKVAGITVIEALPPTNVISIVNPPTTVIGGRMIDFDLSYTKDIPTAYALIRFRGPSGNLEQAFKPVTENEGTVTVTVLSPETAGSNYSLQAQLYTSDWQELDTYNFPGITVEEFIPSGINEIEIVDTATDPINNGSLKEVNIKYNLLQSSRILVEVVDKGVFAGSKIIGAVWVDIPAGNDTITLDLIVNNGFPGTTNRIQARVYEAGGFTQPISIPEIPFIEVGKGDGTITYRGQPFTSGQNSLFAESLGEGYYSNYYIATGWEGPLQAKFGQQGEPSWIEYENQNELSDGHKEFDIKIQKFSWHEDKDFFTDRGYPTALKDISHKLTGTLEGQWSPGSKGKGQINMTAWVTEDGDMEGNRVDIIVHVFDNGGNFRKKYDEQQDRFRNIGEFTSTNGMTYQILRALPGFLGEVASYNLVPDAIVQEDPRADYTNEVISATVDMKDIIDNLIAKEAAYTGAQGTVGINENWQINGLEWTVVGQSGNFDTDNQMIPNGKGKFTFNSYTIPNLSNVPLSTSDVNAAISKLSIYPNPCTDFFTYKLSTDVNEPATVELFTINGRKIKTINTKSSFNNSGTIITSHLSSGIYIVRVTSNGVQETRRLIKK